MTKCICVCKTGFLSPGHIRMPYLIAKDCCYTCIHALNLILLLYSIRPVAKVHASDHPSSLL